MTPGPTLIVACPHCDHLARHRTLASCNTVGARYWTDGAMRAPLLPEPVAITRCEGCGAFFWLEDAREIGRIEPASSDAPREWRAAEDARSLVGAEFLSAIAAGSAATPDRERYLRLHAWWDANARARDADAAAPAEPDFAPEMVENLLRLSALTPATDDENRLLKAEISRELGRFADAQALLAGPLADTHLQPVADIIRTHAELGMRGVIELGRGTG